jgi:hypothetical protein
MDGSQSVRKIDKRTRQDVAEFIKFRRYVAQKPVNGILHVQSSISKAISRSEIKLTIKLDGPIITIGSPSQRPLLPIEAARFFESCRDGELRLPWR